MVYRRQTIRNLPHCATGTTLVEMMIVVLVISILAMAAVPTVRSDQDRARYVMFANNLRTACNAFRYYYQLNGTYPHDQNQGRLPPEMKPHLANFGWGKPTPVGGKWDWDYHASRTFGCKAGVSVYRPDLTDAQMAEIDKLIDDGNIKSGEFYKRSNGYIQAIER